MNQKGVKLVNWYVHKITETFFCGGGVEDQKIMNESLKYGLPCKK